MNVIIYVGAAEVGKTTYLPRTLPCYGNFDASDNVVFGLGCPCLVSWRWGHLGDVIVMTSPWYFQPRQHTPPQGCPLQCWRQCRDTLRPLPMSPCLLLPTAEDCHAGGGVGGGAYFHWFHSPFITLTNPSGRWSSGFCRSVTFGRSESIRGPPPPSESQRASAPAHLELEYFSQTFHGNSTDKTEIGGRTGK